jgi:hypothetical protein
MSESNPYLIAQRANEAKELLENPLLEEAFAQMEVAYLADWRSSGLADLEERERVWLAIKVLEEVKRHLRVVIENGVIAKRDIDRIAGRR